MHVSLLKSDCCHPANASLAWSLPVRKASYNMAAAAVVLKRHISAPISCSAFRAESQASWQGAAEGGLRGRVRQASTCELPASTCSTSLPPTAAAAPDPRRRSRLHGQQVPHWMSLTAACRHGPAPQLQSATWDCRLAFYCPPPHSTMHSWGLTEQVCRAVPVLLRLIPIHAPRFCTERPSSPWLQPRPMAARLSARRGGGAVCAAHPSAAPGPQARCRYCCRSRPQPSCKRTSLGCLQTPAQSPRHTCNPTVWQEARVCRRGAHPWHSGTAAAGRPPAHFIAVVLAYSSGI